MHCVPSFWNPGAHALNDAHRPQLPATYVAQVPKVVEAARKAAVAQSDAPELAT
jgi:hypothetical protein